MAIFSRVSCEVSILYAAVSRIFAAKKWNELSNDIRIKGGTNEVKSKI